MNPALGFLTALLLAVLTSVSRSDANGRPSSFAALDEARDPQPRAVFLPVTP